MELVAGAPIGGKYQLDRAIGEGGMASVWAGRHTTLGSAVAIKVMREEWLKDGEAVKRFFREAQAVASLRTPNVAKVYDVGTLDDGRPYLVMELLVGVDLNTELERRGTIPPLEAAGYVLEAALAIADAHAAGIVHRDLKPANLFLADENGRRVVKVVDFGISRVTQPDETRLTQTQSAFGTPLYMAPESVRSAKLADARTDVWALGVILYELVTGVPPFLGETATAVAVSVTIDEPAPMATRVAGAPPELEEIVRRAIKKRPEERFQTAQEMATALRDALDALSPSRDAPRLSRASLSDVSGPSASAGGGRVPVALSSTAPVERSSGSTGAGLWVAIGVGISLALGGVGIGVLLLRTPAPARLAAGASAAAAADAKDAPPASAEARATSAPSATIEIAPSSPSASGGGHASATPGHTASAGAPPPAASATSSPEIPPALETPPPVATAKPAPTVTTPAPSSTLVRGSPARL